MLEVLFVVAAEINAAFYLGGNPTGKHCYVSELNLCFVNRIRSTVMWLHEYFKLECYLCIITTQISDIFVLLLGVR